MEFMLDTNICIYIIKNKPLRVINRLKKIEDSNVGISAITLSELLYGVSKSSRPAQNLMALAQFTAPLEILPYDDEAAHHYGTLRSHLEKIGKPIGSLDMLIAAHALSQSCTLVTNNEKEFCRIPNLKIDNWAKIKN
jgi:tRNA(fMet)-specific endonuclease VapC